LVFGASCANAGAETASRRPVMTAKLSVFMNVSYLLEHPKDARRPTYRKKKMLTTHPFPSEALVSPPSCRSRLPPLH
jgi:hypothetical protein